MTRDSERKVTSVRIVLVFLALLRLSLIHSVSRQKWFQNLTKRRKLSALRVLARGIIYRNTCTLSPTR
jgi:hypothetical protein